MEKIVRNTRQDTLNFWSSATTFSENAAMRAKTLNGTTPAGQSSVEEAKTTMDTGGGGGEVANLAGGMEGARHLC